MSKHSQFNFFDSASCNNGLFTDAKIKDRENFILEVSRGLELVVDPTLHESTSISGNPKSPKTYYILLLENQFSHVLFVPTLDLSHIISTS